MQHTLKFKDGLVHTIKLNDDIPIRTQKYIMSLALEDILKDTLPEISLTKNGVEYCKKNPDEISSIEIKFD